MTISLFAAGLLDFRLAERVLTRAPRTLSKAERIALEYLQIRRGINSARPRIDRNDLVPPPARPVPADWSDPAGRARPGVRGGSSRFVRARCRR